MRRGDRPGAGGDAADASCTGWSVVVVIAVSSQPATAGVEHLLLLLGEGAKTRSAVLRQLRLNIRGFYRDLEVLRAVGVPIEHNDGHYVLATDVADALERLPFPDPCLTIADARLLAKDKSLDAGEEKGKLRGSYPGAKTRPTGTLTPGERVGSLEVVANPGHTPGHVALLDTRDRTWCRTCGSSRCSL